MTPGALCGALLALAGQLVAPSGLLFEFLFVTLGGYWGRLGPKLQTDLSKNGRQKGTLFKTFVG